MDPYDYGSSLWQACAVCGTRRPPTKLKEGPACNDGWCEQRTKLDDLLARVKALQAAGKSVDAIVDPKAE